MTRGSDTLAPELATTPASRAAKPQAADVLVVFGITGDLAKVMTFRSLYRLEARGLLDCPIVGVAVDDWTRRPAHRTRARSRSREPARSSTRRSSTASPSGCRTSSGDFADAATYERVGDAIGGAATPGLLPRDPAVPLRHGRQGPRRGRPDQDGPRRRREAVRPRPRVGARARRRAAPVHRRVAALPDRPLPREDGRSRRSSTCASRNTMLEPVWNRNYVECVQITMAEDFGVEDRGHFYDPVGALRDVVVNHLMQVVAAAAMEPPSRRRSGDDQGRAGRALPRGRRGRSRALRARPVRRLPRHRRRRAGLDDGDLRRAAARDRELALVRRAVLHPHRQAPRRRPRPSSGSSSSSPRSSASAPSSAPPEPNQLVVKLDPSTGIRLDRRGAPGRHARRRARSTSTWSSRTRAAKAPTPYEVLLHAAMVGDSTALHPAGRRRGDLADHAAAARRATAGALRTRRGRGARRRPTSSSPATAAGTAPGWRNDSRRDKRRAQRAQSAAAPSPFPPIADYAFLSTATPARSSPPTARSTGSASRASTRRACSAACSTAQAGFFRFAPFGINHPTARAYVPGTNVLETTWKTPNGWIVVRDALTMGPRTTRTRSRRTRGRRPTTTPTTCSSARSSASRAASRSSSSASRPSTTAARRRNGRWSTAIATPPTRSGAGQTIRLQSDLALGIEGDRIRARHVLEAGDRAYCALSWAEELAAPQDVEDAERAARRDHPVLARLAADGRGCPTTAGATRSSARRSRSRA